ncbi:MAG: hypothetical protein Q7R33_05100 [Nitrosarchaeum sp.]|nr:hypothetical protein [Nitrosarchaeum sp.]
MNKIEYMLQYEHCNFKREKCGWCDHDAKPRVRDENGQLRLYYKKYLCDDDNCAANRKKHNPRSYETAKKTYKLSDDDAKLKVKQASPFHREYFSSDNDYKNFQAQSSLRAFIDRFGKIEGQEKFDEYRELRSYLASEQHFIDKLGNEQGKIKYEEIRQQKAITRDNLRRKYGEIEGDKRYESFLDKTLKNFVSEKSIDFLETISKTYSIAIRHGRNSTEKKINCANTMHPVDGYCESLNIVFEFFGDKWHVNPRLYSSNDTNIRKKSAIRVWEHDATRSASILQVVNAIFICWEYDWIHNKELVLNQMGQLLEKLKNNSLEKKVYYLGGSDEC